MWPSARPLRLHTSWCNGGTAARKTTQLIRVRIFCSTAWRRDQASPEPAEDEVKSIPYSELSIGVPTEVRLNEKRVAITPQNAALLLKKGFKEVLVEHGAGFQAEFPAHDYEAAGATLVNSARVW
jgi:H+-translocating NAD(P) transhydrogenase